MNTQNMTDEEMRVKIAEALGLELISENARGNSTGNLLVHKKGQVDWYVQADWLNSLDAMHEAEGSLPTIFERAEYQKKLQEITAKPGNPIWFATARQRALAFLTTLP